MYHFVSRWRLPLTALLLASCQSTPERPPEDPLVLLGEALFFNETFDGNGRTCATCHRAEDNFAITPAFIANLPATNALFVAETNPRLKANFESPVLMRKHAVILENQDGFDNLAENFNLRGVPHTLALRTSIASRSGPQTGWSGDGAPGDGSLRSFAVGAVIQHFTKTLNRQSGVDFRLPTEEELDALEAFQLSLGRQQDLILPIALREPIARRGQDIFLDNKLGKCNACHFNAGANADPEIFGADAGNMNFNTGVEALPDQPADLMNQKNPPDDGFGQPGSGEFNTPPLVESADTAPFFHNNSVATLESAVAFYNGEAFNNSPAGQLVSNATGSGINLDATQIEAVASFLRVINVLENLRASVALLQTASSYTNEHPRIRVLASRASFELEDAIETLRDGDLHYQAADELELALGDLRRASRNTTVSSGLNQLISTIRSARTQIEGS